jgi:calcineurin-like phosphoesterase family protein
LKYFVTSDLHLGHGNIIKYANRPFVSSDEMNSVIIRNWNMRVKAEDTVFHLGDFCFKSGLGCVKADYWIEQLNGNKIFIRGNHDNNNSLKTIIDGIHITYAIKRIRMCHKPEHANPDYEINLVGHVHQNWSIRTFKQHYDIIEGAIRDNKDLVCDRPQWLTFLGDNAYKRDSESILFNVGVDVNKFMPVTLDEVLGQIIRFKKGIPNA